MPDGTTLDAPVFRLLGPLRLDLPTRQVDLGSGKQSCLLACLLLAPGQPIPADTLIDRIWGDRPPRNAGNVLATHATRLRQTLQKADCPPDLLQLRHASGGYLADCDPRRVDLHNAHTLIAGARPATDPRQAADLLARALDKWEPVALAGIPGDWAGRVRDGLQQERLMAITRWAEAMLRLNDTEQVIERLRPLFAQHPDAEELAAPLMTALSAAGYSAQALDIYVRLRQALADTLGTEPSPRLQQIHLQVLRGQSDAAAPEPPTPPAPPAPEEALARPPLSTHDSAEPGHRQPQSSVPTMESAAPRKSTATRGGPKVTSRWLIVGIIAVLLGATTTALMVTQPWRARTASVCPWQYIVTDGIPAPVIIVNQPGADGTRTGTYSPGQIFWAPDPPRVRDGRMQTVDGWIHQGDWIRRYPTSCHAQ
jgi:DNA-binding SARP family transcriptional activator